MLAATFEIKKKKSFKEKGKKSRISEISACQF